MGCSQEASLSPLSNTLFTLHPPLLVISVTASVFCLYHRQASAWRGLSLLGLAMFGGGFWSSQELNWGGWWNWDVLEMGSLVVWAVAAAGAHAASGAATCRRFAWLTATTSSTFYLLNKTGLGVSIHSFVASGVVRTNYVACVILATLLLNTQTTVGSLAMIACCVAYSGATSFGVFKLPAAAVVFLRVPSRSWQSGLHAAARVVACAAVIFNYFNTVLTGFCNSSPNISLISGGPRASVSFDGYRVIHRTGWRAKPLSLSGSCLGSISMRSSSGASRWVAYAK